MADLLRGLGRRVAIINLDPANEKVGYTADIEVSLEGNYNSDDETVFFCRIINNIALSLVSK